MRVVKYDPTQVRWVPWSDRDRDGNTDNIGYDGQLVACSNFANTTADDRWPDGVMPAGSAAGAADTTEEVLLKGIIYGNNNRDNTRDATYGLYNITGVLTQANITARSVSPVGGGHPIGARRPMVQIHEITPFTEIEIPIYNATYGTAITVLTASAASTDGLTVTHANTACDFTPVANLNTIYCRTGANKGDMRQTDDVSTTTTTVDQAFEFDIAIGDTFVKVPLRQYGLSFIQLDAESLFINGAASPATNFYMFHVKQLFLHEAGKERVIGCFDPVHFTGTRAT